MLSDADLKDRLGFNINARDMTGFVACVCDKISMPCAYACGRLRCVSVSTNEWADKCMHGNVFSVCHCESVCTHKHFFALTGLVLAEFDLSTSRKAPNTEQIVKTVAEISSLNFPSDTPQGLLLGPFSLWPATELFNLLHDDTLAQT